MPLSNVRTYLSRRVPTVKAHDVPTRIASPLVDADALGCVVTHDRVFATFEDLATVATVPHPFGRHREPPAKRLSPWISRLGGLLSRKCGI